MLVEGDRLPPQRSRGLMCDARLRMRRLRGKLDPGKPMASASESDRPADDRALGLGIAAVASMRTSQLNASITRGIAGCWRFFTLIQCFDRPG
jgi:hypothetical protein